MILLVDIGISNLASVQRALELVGAEVLPSSEPEALAVAEAVVLPGVGSFADGMNRLRERRLVEPLRRAAGRGVPILGICLGMQLLTCESEEDGRHEGLGLIDGRCVRLDPCGTSDRVPNIGWCDVEVTQQDCLLGSKMDGEVYYFAHSYHVDGHVADSVASIRFGNKKVTAAIESGNTYGVQFHPEKSQDAGLELLSAFLKRASVSRG